MMYPKAKGTPWVGALISALQFKIETSHHLGQYYQPYQDIDSQSPVTKTRPVVGVEGDGVVDYLLSQNHPTQELIF